MEKKEQKAKEYTNEACRPLWRAGTEQICMADFIAGWDACLKHLGEIPWDEAMNEITSSVKANHSGKPNTLKENEP